MIWMAKPTPQIHSSFNDFLHHLSIVRLSELDIVTVLANDRLSLSDPFFFSEPTMARGELFTSTAGVSRKRICILKMISLRFSAKLCVFWPDSGVNGNKGGPLCAVSAGTSQLCSVPNPVICIASRCFILLANFRPCHPLPLSLLSISILVLYWCRHASINLMIDMHTILELPQPRAGACHLPVAPCQ